MSIGFKRIDLDGCSRAERYKLLTGAVVPRPIAFVTSLGPNGAVNAAPFSQFIILAVDPGLLAFSVGPREDGPGEKDTLRNARATGEFVINMVCQGWERILQDASQNYASDVSEVELLNLRLIDSELIATPRLADAHIQFECRLHDAPSFGDAPNHLVIGRVLAMHINPAIMNDGKIDPAIYQPVARIGGRNYAALGEVVSV